MNHFQLQATAWLGMSITALVSYNCHYDFAGTTANFGTILRLTIFHMYFRGDCTPNAWPTTDFTALQTLNLMTPSNVYIWMWVVAALSLLWFVTSVVLITSAYRLGFRVDDNTLIDFFSFLSRQQEKHPILEYFIVLLDFHHFHHLHDRFGAFRPVYRGL